MNKEWHEYKPNKIITSADKAWQRKYKDVSININYFIFPAREELNAYEVDTQIELDDYKILNLKLFHYKEGTSFDKMFEDIKKVIDKLI